jgi:hypothetical protein
MSMPLMKATQYQLQDDALMKGGAGIIGAASSGVCPTGDDDSAGKW